MNKHLVADIVEQYVIGALDSESVRFVEGHVAQCPACAKLLQQEAALEVALHETAQHRKVVSLSSRRRRIGAVVASAAAVLAAGLALVFSIERGHRRRHNRSCAAASTRPPHLSASRRPSSMG